MAEELTTIQAKVSTRDSLRELAVADLRSITSELEWLVLQENARRAQEPTPAPTEVKK